MGVPDLDAENDQQSSADDLDEVELAFDEIGDSGDAENRSSRKDGVGNDSPQPHEDTLSKPAMHGVLNGHDVYRTNRGCCDNANKKPDQRIFEKRHGRSFSRPLILLLKRTDLSIAAPRRRDKTRGNSSPDVFSLA